MSYQRESVIFKKKIEDFVQFISYFNPEFRPSNLCEEPETVKNMGNMTGILSVIQQAIDPTRKLKDISAKTEQKETSENEVNMKSLLGF